MSFNQESVKKKQLLKSTILFTLSLISIAAYSQENLYTQNFEGSSFNTYQLYNSSNIAVGFTTTGTDYITRAIPTSLPLGNLISGLTGNVIAFEDHDGAGFNGDYHIDTDAINITGAKGLTMQVRIVAPRGNDGNRYEADDFLRVQVSIDEGPFTTVINTGGGSDNRYYYDAGNDGINLDGNDQLLDQSGADQLISNIPISGSGNSLVLRFLFNSSEPQEEIIFDDISVDAIMVTLSNEEFILDKAFSIYSNPTKGKITIGNSGIDLDRVQISDLNGRVIVNYDLNGTTEDKELNLSSILSSGVYLNDYNLSRYFYF